jgi:hypothetical protein
MRNRTMLPLYSVILLMAMSQIAQCMSISDTKALPDGQSVTLGQKAITYASSGFFYIEEDTRYVGIRVDKAGHDLAVGMRADITGVIRTDDNLERYVAATSAVHNGDKDLPPLGMANKLLGGGDFHIQPGSTCGQQGITGLKGVNNIGLLVRVMGYVTDSGTYPRTNVTWFYINDGSNVEDGTGAIGLYCETENIDPPKIGSLLRVTGISSCELYDNNLVNMVWVRDIEDIPLAPAEPPQPPAQTAATARAGFSPDIQAPEGGIKVSWDASLAGGKDVIEYQIWRDNETTPVGAVIPNGLSFFIDDVAGFSGYLTYSVVDSTTHTRSINTTLPYGVTAGTIHQYYVSAVYRVEQPSGSGLFKYFETDRTYAGAATVIWPMTSTDLMSPYPRESYIDLLAGVNFQFYSRRGADSYVIQISTSPLFSAPEYTSPIVHFGQDADNIPISFSSGNISNLLSNLPGDTQLWWRVGARNSHDNPGPLPYCGNPGMTFLFSEPSSFFTAEMPPPPDSGTGSVVGLATARAGLSPDIPSATGGIKVSWDPYSFGISPFDVVEYHIWRDIEENPIGAVVPDGLSSFIDDVNYNRIVFFSRIDPVSHTQSREMVCTYGAVPGYTHQYYVSAVYRKETPIGSGLFQYFETARAPTGLATLATWSTPIFDCFTPMPGEQNIDINSAMQFGFQCREKMDSYIIQVSTSPTFSAPEYTSPIIVSPYTSDRWPISFAANKIGDSLGSVAGGHMLWWRVGARNSQDTPGPLPNMGFSNMCFLFSGPSMFIVAENPPPPVSGGPIRATARAGLTPDIPTPEGGVRVSWTPYEPYYGDSVVEYHIWRDVEPAPIGVADSASTSFIDDAGVEPRSFSYSVLDPVNHLITTAITKANRPSVEFPHQYFVSALYRSEDPVGSGSFKYYESNKAPTGLATISRRLLSQDLLQPMQGEMDIDLTGGISFQFGSRMGSDTYVIQVSSDPTFLRAEYTSPAILYSSYADYLPVSFNTGNISAYFTLLPEGTQLWWRVGMRCSLDRPGPVANMGNGMNYMFSQPSMFYVAETPPPPSEPALVTARAGFPPDIDAPEGGIRIGWSEPFAPATGHGVVEYHIWRDIEPAPIGVVQSASSFVDDVGAEVRTFCYSVADPVTNGLTTAGAAASRPTTGLPHQYYVSALYQVEQPAGSGIMKYYETNKIPAGLATICRKMLTDDLLEPMPGQIDVEPQYGINFQFYSRMGADTYAIQISSNPTFLAPEYTSPAIVFSPYMDNVPIPFNTGNIAGCFSSLPGATQLWWRVGMRNSLDNPGPMANMGIADMNYLFSEPSTFFLAETPPPPGSGFGSIVGRVIDGDTSLPVSGATITCSSITTSSGADGKFTILSVPSGIRNVTATKGASSTTAQVILQADLTVTTGDMQLFEAPPPPPPGP